MLVECSNIDQITKLKVYLGKEFAMKDLGVTKQILGLLTNGDI